MNPVRKSAFARHLGTALCLLLLAGVLTSCAEAESDREKGEAQMEKRQEQTLVGLEYEKRAGMVYGGDCLIQIRRGNIVSAAVFSKDEYVTVSNTPIQPEAWEAIEEAVRAILPVLEEAPPQKANTLGEKLRKLIGQPTDGPDTFRFCLTWQQEDGTEETVAYEDPNDRRFSTLVTILEETVDPIGREIISYEAPCVQGIYFARGDFDSGRPDQYSYQLTPKDMNAENPREWRFYAYYGQDGNAKSLQRIVDQERWTAVWEQCSGLGLEALPQGDRKKESFVTLYWTDGRQETRTADKDTGKALQTIFEDLVQQIKQEEMEAEIEAEPDTE